MIKKLLTLCMLIMISGSVSLNAESQTPHVRLNHVSTYQGHTVYVYLTAADFDNVSALDLKIFYDDEKLSLVGYSAQSWLNSSLKSESDEAGVLHLSWINETGLSGSGHLYRLTFRVHSEVPAGEIPLFLAVSEAVDASLSPLTVDRSHGSINVREVTSQQPQLYASGSLSRSSLKEGERFTYSISVSNRVTIGAGTFEMHYDHEYLRLVDTHVGSSLESSGTYATINDAVRGLSRMTLISLDGLKGAYPFVTYEFEVIKDTNGTTPIRWESTEVYDEDLNVIKGRTITQTVRLIQHPTVTVNPKIYLPHQAITAGEEFTVPLKIEAESSLGAATITLQYNPFLLDWESLEIHGDSDSLMIYTHDAERGQITFSYLNQTGLTTAATMASITFTAKPLSEPLQTEISVDITTPINAQYEAITLDTIPTQIQISNDYRITYKGPNDETLQEDVVVSLEESTPPTPVNVPGHRFAHWRQSITGNQVSYQAEYYMFGDINDDGVFDAEDMQLMHTKMVKKETLTALEHLAMDVNQDGEITLDDLVLLELLHQGRLLDSDF